jgi:glucose/arabinose dehydrogenase
MRRQDGWERAKATPRRWLAAVGSRRTLAGVGLVAGGLALVLFGLFHGRSGSTPVTVGPSFPGLSPGAVPAVTLEDAFPSLPDLDRPLVMLQIPGEARMLVVLQDGRIVSFAKDAKAVDVQTVLDWREKTSRDGNEEGLLGLALDPRFGENGYLYVYYSAKDGARRTVLSRFKTSGAGSKLRVDAASELVILEIPQPFSNHKGGCLVFGPDGMLYLGLGDGGDLGDPNGNGQDLKNNLLGSIIRIDVRGATKEKPYTIPKDNPFANATDGTRGETWAYGLRNPWRFSFDRQTGLLIVADVGEEELEEIDVIAKGGNYGWNIMEGSQCFKPQTGCQTDGLSLPIAEYRHEDDACSVTGGYVYRGRAVKELLGAYLYGDFCSGAVWAIPAIGSNSVRPRAVQLRSKGPEIASFAVDQDGELYILSFDGRIYAVRGK